MKSDLARRDRMNSDNQATAMWKSSHWKAKQGGLAKKLHIASQDLFETGTIPVALIWDAIHAAIEPIYIRQHPERNVK